MRSLKLVLGLIAPFALCSNVALAATEPDDEITMSVIEEGESPDRVLAPIELPEPVAEAGAVNSESGRETARQAREQGREFGEAQAEEARERGAEARESANENAENARERAKDNVGRDDLENIPDDVRDNIPEDVRERGRGDPPGRRDGG